MATTTPARVAGFSARAILETRGVWRHTGEVLRQVGILVTGTTLLIIGMELAIGSTCGLFGDYALRSLGGVDYVGAVTSLCTTRGASLVMIGYVLSAKVGCGLVAEIGSMRISEELDAFDSVGLSPMRFVVGTRLAAMWLFIPFLFCVAQASAELGSYLAVVVNLGDVSRGTFEAVHFGLRNPVDYVYILIESVAVATTIVLVASYYGYTVRGGPAEVGQATARSMVANLVLLHAIYALGTYVFWGSSLGIPIGG